MINKKLKVAIVHDFLIKLGGAEKVLLVLHRIFPEAPIFTLLYDKKRTRGKFEGSGFKIIPSKLIKYPKIIRNRHKILLTKFPSAIEKFDLSSYDIIISSSNSFSHGVLTDKKTFHITYCYSPCRYLWDWSSEYLNENDIGFGPVGLAIRNILSKIRLWDFYASKRTNMWIAISKTVKNRIKKYYRIDSKVINPPIDVEKINISRKPPENYYVIISRLEPYKKIDLAVEAFNKNGRNLKIVGEGSESKYLQNIAKENIEFLGYLDDGKKIEILNKAKALIFPGEEDFGLTPIEAMACGVAVIAFKKGGVTESVIPDETGVFFEDDNIESLNKAVLDFEKNHHKFSQIKCRERAEKFSEERFIKEFKNCVLDGYRKFINKNT